MALIQKRFIVYGSNHKNFKQLVEDIGHLKFLDVGALVQEKIMSEG